MTSSHPEKPLGAASHLSGFDGLRAIAVLAVALYHFSLTVPVFPGAQNGTYSENAYSVSLQLRVGVWIFFILSGFLLYRPFASAHTGRRPDPSVRRYARSRVLRIWPAYAVALTVLTFVWHEIPFHGGREFFVHLFLLQNYVSGQFTKGIGPAWSLVVEVAFYVTLPLFAGAVAWAARRLGTWRAEWIGLGAYVVIGLVWQTVTAGDALPAAMLPGFLPTFAIGMALAVCIAHGRDLGLSRVARHAGWCWAGALGILVAKGMIDGVDGFQPGFRVPQQLAYTAIATLVVLPAVFGRADGRPNRLLRSAPFHGLGVISYGVFLWSIFVIRAAQFEWVPIDPFFGRTLLVGLVSLAAMVAIGTASWFVVERPALRLKAPRRASAAQDPPGIAREAVDG
ncbi:MAG: acyltransferase family protein [Acidimicrobiia bacterium]